MEGDVLWEPPEQLKSASNIARYMAWLGERRGLRFSSYNELWRWSVDDLEGFWSSIWSYFEVAADRPYTRVLSGNGMPGARWFAGAELNYVQRALSRHDDHPAILSCSETRPLATMSYAQLYDEVTRASAGLRRLGVGRGDRVAALLPNIPQTVVAFLATASIGAIWSSCAPEFGTHSVIDRFRQIEPTVLLAVDGYQYSGRAHGRLDAVRQVQASLPTLKHTVVVPYLAESPSLSRLNGAVLWDELLADDADLAVEPVPFEHPLWVLYSSGTTGLPKPIVHGHGGILLEHLKTLALHMDITENDRLFWFTTAGWMMWNFLLGGLLAGATIVLYDGSPGYPDMGALWRLAQDAGVTYFGASAPYIEACMKAGVSPGREFDLGRVKGLGSTGSPLSPEGFQWVYEHVSPDLLLGSISGGTDLCTGFVGPCPLLPVRAGEIQCRCLGASIEAFDPDGNARTRSLGELVITRPMPSMPLYLWNDPNGARYRESYFDTYPGVWRHGDWLKVTERGGCVITGRSDSTLNRGGVRMGTSEFYSVVEELPEVADSLVVDTGGPDAEGRLILFLVLADGADLDDALRDKIKGALRRDLSPRHVPDAMHVVPEVPRTLNGKKLEVPVKRILGGAAPDEAVSRDAMVNPDCLDFFVQLAASMRAEGR